jgi:hypothetical protein
MIPISTILVIAILLGVSLTELAKDLARFFIAIAVSALIIISVVGLVVTAPHVASNLLAILILGVMAASFVITMTDKFKARRRQIKSAVSTLGSGPVAAPPREAQGDSDSMASAGRPSPS